MRSGELGNGDAKGAATDVVEAASMTKLDGIRITTMLATDADLEILLGPAPAFYANLDELTDAGLV